MTNRLEYLNAKRFRAGSLLWVNDPVGHFRKLVMVLPGGYYHRDHADPALDPDGWPNLPELLPESAKTPQYLSILLWERHPEYAPPYLQLLAALEQHGLAELDKARAAHWAFSTQHFALDAVLAALQRQCDQLALAREQRRHPSLPGKAVGPRASAGG